MVHGVKYALHGLSGIWFCFGINGKPSQNHDKKQFRCRLLCGTINAWTKRSKPKLEGNYPIFLSSSTILLEATNGWTITIWMVMVQWWVSTHLWKPNFFCHSNGVWRSTYLVEICDYNFGNQQKLGRNRKQISKRPLWRSEPGTQKRSPSKSSVFMRGGFWLLVLLGV